MEQSVSKKCAYVSEENTVENQALEQGQGTRTEVRRWVDELSIKIPSVDFSVNTLSGGNQQRVVIAKWLAINEVLILDSPTVGIDVAAKDSIYKIVRELAQKAFQLYDDPFEAEEAIYHQILRT
jgi:simple sugar transport system ATP-binding protein